MPGNMKRPYVICHMGSTVNGRIIGERWGKDSRKYGALYEQCHKKFKSQAWMVGRVTMEKDFTEGRRARPRKPGRPIPREPFIGDRNASSYAIAVDAHGKLGWAENSIDGDHVIEILSESVGDGYLQYLRDHGISYIFAGKRDLDFTKALDQLHHLFGIRTLMLEGGGNINGSLLHAGLIDELSLLIFPIADGDAGSPTTFEVAGELPRKAAQQLSLIEVQNLKHGVVWLRYKSKRS